MFLKVCQDNGWKSFGMEPDEGAAKIATQMGLTVFSDKVKLNSYAPADLKFDAITSFIKAPLPYFKIAPFSAFPEPQYLFIEPLWTPI